MKTPYQNTTQHGFTLIEISIVMIIVGLMVVGFIQSYKIYDEKRKIELTELRFNDIEQAINNYALINGRLPCPAARNVPGAVYDSGKAVDCATAIPAGVIDVPGQDVLIGLLPTYDLGISHGSSRDAHNYAFTYAVTKSLATGTASGAGGAITVNEEYFEDVNADPNIQDIQRKTQSYPDVQYVVLSMGESGAGAYAYDGAPLYGGTGVYACQGDDTTDGENCDDDHIFTDSRAANNFYDDRVRYKRLLPVLTASNDGGCEQQDSFATNAASCPDGWEENPDFSGSTAGQRNDGNMREPAMEYRIDDETGDYYLVPVLNPSYTAFTGVYGSSGNSGKTYTKPYAFGARLCTKKSENKTKTKCFTEQASVASPYYAQPNEDSCPDGWRMIGVEPTGVISWYGENGDRSRVEMATICGR